MAEASSGSQKRLAPEHHLPAAKRQRQIRRRLAPRASQACHACALSKLRCDNNPICKRCARKDVACVRDSQLSDWDDDQPQEQVPFERNALGVVTPTVTTHFPPGAAVDDPKAAANPELTQNNSGMPLSSCDTAGNARLTSSADFAASLHDDLNSRGLLPAQDSTDGFAGNILPLAWNFDISFDVDNEFDWGGWELDANEVDFLSSLGLSQSNEIRPPPQGTHTALASPVASSGNESTYTVQQAFRESIGQWTPDSGHYRASGEKNMVSEDLIGLKMDVLAQWDSLISSEILVPRTRDKLIAMAVASCEPGNISAIISAFPAVDVLERLINISLTQQKASVDGYIHIPTFSKFESRVETLAAMVVNGTSGSSSRAVQKFGYGLGEILSCNLHSLAEREYSITRDLQYLQAFCMNLHDGLWSGIKNKMELAGSTSGVLINMLRVGARFCRATYRSILPEIGDFGEILDNKWRLWAEQESFKRIVYHMHTHCVQESFMNSTTGSQLSSSELSLPLPETRDLWLASSALHWKQISLQLQAKGQFVPPSVIDCIGTPGKVHSEGCDREFAILAQLYSIASLIRVFKNTQSLFATEDSNLHRLTLIADETQERRLAQTIQTLDIENSDYECPGTAAWNLLREFASMHLHTSFDQLEILAGREGPDEARRIYPGLRSWFESESSRRALWHAGQVLRHMRVVHSNNLHVFHALACYHASLSLCVYGLLSNFGGSQASPIPASTKTASFFLDGEETPTTRRWILLGAGNPTIKTNTRSLDVPSQSDDSISIHSIRDIMSVAVDIVHHKFQERSRTRPLLVDNICRLMQSIGTLDQAEPFDLRDAPN